MKIIGRSLYFVFGLVAGFTIGQCFADYTVDPDAQIAIAEKGYRNLEKGVKVLLACPVLAQTYPDEYKRILQVYQRTTLIFLTTDIPGVCAIAPPSIDAIIITPNVWLDHSRGCYGSIEAEVYAHEFLHKIGLPPHKYYSDIREYFAKDPIEQVIKECFFVL